MYLHYGVWRISSFFVFSRLTLPLFFLIHSIDVYLIELFFTKMFWCLSTIACMSVNCLKCICVLGYMHVLLQSCKKIKLGFVRQFVVSLKSVNVKTFPSCRVIRIMKIRSLQFLTIEKTEKVVWIYKALMTPNICFEIG